MPNWKRLLITLVVAVVVLAVGGLVVGILLTHFLVDWWWFKALDFEPYFWLRLLYRYILSGGVTLFFFLIFFLNFWAASRYLGVDETEFSLLAQSPEGTGYQRLMHRFQTGSMQVYLPFSVVLAALIAAPFYQHWEEALLFFFGPGAGLEDPLYHKDVSFYLFSLPMYTRIQNALLWTFIILSGAMAVLYWVEHHVVPTQRKQWPPEARAHLAGLLAVTALIQGWGFMLQRYGLLHLDRREPLFYGPGFVDMNYQLPLIWVCLIAFLGAAFSLLAFVFERKAFKSTVLCGGVFVAAFALRQMDTIPHFLDKYVVPSNPVTTEHQYMQANIDATVAAYGLGKVQYLDFEPATDLRAELDRLGPVLQQHLANIPVWDEDLLDEVFQQLQGIRPYYEFSSVDVGRYHINDSLQQVDLAAREVNLNRLPEAAKTWENRHLRYTHGFGVVMIPAAQRGDEPMQWYLKGLDLESPVGLSIKRPDIYYGLEDLDYAIVPNKLDVEAISASEPDYRTPYRAQGGVPISSLFSKLLFSVYFRDPKIFFSVNVSETSNMLFRRNIVERMKTLTPFLELDNDAYVAVTPDSVYWVQDAYTVSEHYPVSKPFSFDFRASANGTEKKTFNYIRNSVKVVIDAYDGMPRFYVVDLKDPVIQAYRRAYPGLFRDVHEMPPLLKEQLRYPRDLFTIQMREYARYHQTNPNLFYQQSETWDFARNIGVTPARPMRPYYLTIPSDACPGMQKFVLISPMTPVGRDNLSVLALASPTEPTNCKPEEVDYAGNVAIYKFPQRQIDGPAQISALIDQDPIIREQFTLWDQRGSRVTRGRTIVLPIGHAVVYVQPVYMVASTATRIPQLVRVIVSMGTEVVMERSLDEALNKLVEKLKAHEAGGARPASSAPAAAKPKASMGAPNTNLRGY